MEVYVIGMNGLGLMPTTPRKARLLLHAGRAEVVRKIPFTIRLLYKTGCHTQPTDLGIDTGSQHIGVAVVAGNSVVTKEEFALRSSMAKRSLMETRKEYRRGRRYRKTRYRHPKFKPHTKRVYTDQAVRRNKHQTHWKKIPAVFTSDRQEGWLPPSIESKVDHHIRIIGRHMEALPRDMRLTIEVARFDVARIKDPSIHGELYQRGRLYDEENVKAYVFARDQYTCQVCKRKAGSYRDDGSVVKLKAHHLDFKSRGATDNPDRMITVCTACHTTEAHQPGGILYQWMVEGKTVSRGYRDETFMNILRQRLFRAFPYAQFTYGNITNADRKTLGLPKTHANDAVAIANGPEQIDDGEENVYYQQVRSRKRSLHEAKARKGRKTPNRNAVRNAKNTKSITCGKKKYHVFDKVCCLGQVGWITGFTGTSCRVVDAEGSYIQYPGKTYTQVNAKDIRVIAHNHNWLCGVRTSIGKG